MSKKTIFNIRSEEFILEDSKGKKESFKSGAVRDTAENKTRYDLIPPHALKRLADIYMKGAKKYDERNWEKGIPFNRCIASAMRHLEAFRLGINDEDHLAQCVWNLFAIMEFQDLNRNDLDDMIKYEKKNN